MEGSNHLGVYLSKGAATVVCLGLEGKSRNVLGCFSVTVEAAEEQKLQELVRLITEGCAKRGLKFSEVAVALDCSMFMQHNVRSKFNDPRQIAATVRFDAEEALAMDITDLAIAFKVTSSDQTGSSLTVFTAQKKQLSDILISLQSNNIDPVTIEPDVNCLSRFILQNVSLPQDSRPLFCVLSNSSGYFIAFAESRETRAMRTFLVRPAQGRNELLAREVPVTTALVGTDGPLNCIKVFDSAGSVNYQQLNEKLGIEVSSVDLIGTAVTGPEALADCADPVGFAIAYGAVLYHLEKAQTVNFRNDFMPYQGKKVRLQKAMKFSSAAVIVLMLAVGVYFQLQLWQENKYRSRLREKFEKQYSAVMLGKKLPAGSDPVKKLTSELRRIENVKKGLLSVTGEEAISAKLTLVLDAFNKCAAQTNLNIDSISITTKTISITGDTSSRENTLKLFDAIRDSGLEVLQQYLEAKGGRDNFSVTVEPKK
ncbi:MAG: type II secretion system protein GspL [Sedimentisphaerales bacterium]